MVDEEAPPGRDDWAGDLPFYIVLEPSDGLEGGNVGIDLDVKNWAKLNRPTFRRPGVWFLVSKATNDPVLAMPTEVGDQFFYHRHAVGIIASEAIAQVMCHVIGKKRRGKVTRLVLMPNGMVMTGTEAEVDPIASRMIGVPEPPNAPEA